MNVTITLTIAQAKALASLADNSTGDEQDMEAVLGSNRQTWEAAYRAIDKLNEAIQENKSCQK